MRCGFEVFFGGFRQISAYFGHWVYFGLSSNRNQREIPRLLSINFGISEILAILYYLNLDACIDNVSPIVVAFWFRILHLKSNIDKSEEKFQVCSRSRLG